MRFSNCEQTVRRTLLLALIFLVPSAQAMLPIDDPDIWWRLRVGEWIINHHSVPHVDFFLAHDVSKPWIEYSWLFAVLAYGTHHTFGLYGLVGLVVGFALAIAFGVYRLVRDAGLPFPAQAALAGLGLVTMKTLMTPRPWLISILFFAIELGVIFRARAVAKDRPLWFLPLLFFVWSNFHIQFVYGLAAIGLLFGETLVVVISAAFGYRIEAPSFPPRRLALVTLACAGATLLTPYHILIYQQVINYMFERSAEFQLLSELHPMFFRTIGDWIALLLALAAAFALGWRRSWSPFPIALYLMAMALAFRARRDVWMLALVAVAVIAESTRRFQSAVPYRFSAGQVSVTVAAVAGILYALALNRGITDQQLQAAVAAKFPVSAVQYVKANRLAGPLYNHYDWGGFLLWSLPELPPVMDGRTNLFDDARIERSLETWNGGPGWETDPDLLKAKLVIAEKDRVLTSLLRTQPNYKIVYEDGTAVVFVRLT
jgi:hypothetical protein